MYIAATKAQAETVIGQVSATTVVYAKVLTNVTQIGMATTAGWIGLAITGAYAVSDLLTAFPNAIEVTAVVL